MSRRCTPSSSRTAGSMSRGTAMSIRSSGRPLRAVHHRLELVALDDVVRRAGRGDHDVGLLELRGQRVEAHGLAAEPLGEPDRAVVVAVRDEHGATRRARSAPARSARRSRPAPITTTRRPLRSPSVSCASCDRDRADRHGAAADRGLGAHALAGRERLAEEAVHERAGRVLHQRELVRALHLPLDLGLADDHRVEAGGDAEQVARRVGRCAASRGGRPARSAGCRPARARIPSAVRLGLHVVADRPCRAPCGCRSRARPPRGCARVETSSRSTLTARPSGSATRSRSSTGAVLCEMPMTQQVAHRCRSPFAGSRSPAAGSAACTRAARPRASRGARSGVA